MSGPERFIVWVGVILLAIVMAAMAAMIVNCLYNIAMLLS